MLSAEQRLGKQVGPVSAPGLTASPMFLCFPFSLGGWSTQEAVFSYPAFPHLCLSSPWILFKNNGSKEGQSVKVLTTKPQDLSSGLSTHIMEGENWLLSTCTQTYAKLIDAMFLIVSKGQKPEIEKKKRNCNTRASMFLSPLYAQSSYNNRVSPSHNILFQDFGSPSLVYPKQNLTPATQVQYKRLMKLKASTIWRARNMRRHLIV